MKGQILVIYGGKAESGLEVRSEWKPEDKVAWIHRIWFYFIYLFIHSSFHIFVYPVFLQADRMPVSSWTLEKQEKKKSLQSSGFQKHSFQLLFFLIYKTNIYWRYFERKKKLFKKI